MQSFPQILINYVCIKYVYDLFSTLLQLYNIDTRLKEGSKIPHSAARCATWSLGRAVCVRAVFLCFWTWKKMEFWEYKILLVKLAFPSYFCCFWALALYFSPALDFLQWLPPHRTTWTWEYIDYYCYSYFATRCTYIWIEVPFKLA